MGTVMQKKQHTNQGLYSTCSYHFTTFAILAMLLFPVSASALVVRTWNGEGTPQVINDTAPADDPGWHNTSSNRSSIYLGNQWVISAKHAGTGSVRLPSGVYEEIPGTKIALSNPGSFSGTSLTTFSDLQMFRINTNPDTGLTPEDQDPLVKNITISTSTPSFNTEVLMIGAGNTRSLNPSGFNGQIDFGSNDYGFDTVGSGSFVKTWGTNKIASTSSVSGITREGLNVLVEFGDPGPNDTIGVLTRFDRGHNIFNTPISDGSLPDEAQASGGDSGGPVFMKNGSDEWVLAGLMHAIYVIGGHSTGDAWFGDLTGISDLSHYEAEIQSLLATNSYSTIGDIDLDGSITGEIVNGEATGDLALLVENWGYQQAVGDIYSWKKGDLNQDGITNLDDFSLMREALGGNISATAITALVAATAVPEPSATILLLMGCLIGVKSRQR